MAVSDSIKGIGNAISQAIANIQSNRQTEKIGGDAYDGIGLTDDEIAAFHEKGDAIEMDDDIDLTDFQERYHEESDPIDVDDDLDVVDLEQRFTERMNGYDDKLYQQELTDAKKKLTDELNDVTNDEKYKAMQPYDAYLCRTLGKEVMKMCEYASEASDAGLEDKVIVDAYHELMEESETSDDFYEKVGYAFNKQENVEPNSSFNLKLFVRGNTACEYAKEKGLNLTVSQMEDLYEAKSSEEAIEQLRKDQIENSRFTVKGEGGSYSDTAENYEDPSAPKLTASNQDLNIDEFDDIYDDNSEDLEEEDFLPF